MMCALVKERADPVILLLPLFREHYEIEAPSSPKSMAPDDCFEIGNLDEIDEMTSGFGTGGGVSGQQSLVQNSSQFATEPQHKSTPSIDTIEEVVTERGHSISDHVTTIRRVRHLDGWDVDTSPEKMKHIILLGCRMGFCGALGTFASLNASVVRLLKVGLYGEALMGYAISIQLGIVSYRFGQHLAVYIFVWRCRRETKREERGGYGLRLQHMDIEEDVSSATIHPSTQEPPRRRRYISVRACATFVFFATFVSLILAIIFFPAHRPYLISLLFTPFGCLARWKLMNKYNKSLPGFPLGTFACNIGGCALSGSLASFIAGKCTLLQRIIDECPLTLSQLTTYLLYHQVTQVQTAILF
jgi:fluoride ion exporter CrcB/FEX